MFLFFPVPMPMPMDHPHHPKITWVFMAEFAIVLIVAAMMFWMTTGYCIHRLTRYYHRSWWSYAEELILPFLFLAIVVLAVGGLISTLRAKPWAS